MNAALLYSYRPLPLVVDHPQLSLAVVSPLTSANDVIASSADWWALKDAKKRLPGAVLTALGVQVSRDDDQCAFLAEHQEICERDPAGSKSTRCRNGSSLTSHFRAAA